MTDFTEETKTQAPHWKSEDITDRTVTRSEMDAISSRGAMAKHIHNDIAAEVARIDMENTFGDKPTISHTEETKSTIDWSEESK